MESPWSEYTKSEGFSKCFTGGGRERGKFKNLYLNFRSFIVGMYTFSDQMRKTKNWIFRKIYEIFWNFQRQKILSHRDLSFPHGFGGQKNYLNKINNFFGFQWKVNIFSFFTIISKLLKILQKFQRIWTAEIESVRLRYFLSKILKGWGREGDLKLRPCNFVHFSDLLNQPEIYIYIQYMHIL